MRATFVDKYQIQTVYLFTKSSQYTRCICLEWSNKSNI